VNFSNDKQKIESSNESNDLISKFKMAEKYYVNPLQQRNLIREENNGKVGVYCWVNKVNGKLYIGSGDPLYLRISDYYQNWYLNSRYNLYIVRAFKKYGMLNFSLVILEYTNSIDVIKSEQNWIDLFKPEYNTNPIAGSSKGYTHTVESLEKMRDAALGKKHSDLTKKAMSDSRKGEKNPFYGKTHLLESLDLIKSAANKRVITPVTGIKVEITDLESKTTTFYDSIRKAAQFINSDIKTILRREKTQLEKGINTPYRKRYIITLDRSTLK